MTLLAPAERWAKYRMEPDAWVRDTFGVEPDPWQRDALRAIAREKVAIRSGHGVGKTTLAAWTTLWGLAVWLAVVPCTAPTQHQLWDLLWAEIDRWLARAPSLAAALEKTQTRIEVKGYSQFYAVARVGRNPEGMAGFHAARLLYVIDEASGIKDATMAVVDGALTTESAKALMLGNPTRSSGYFADAFGRNREQWTNRTISAEQSARVARQWVENMAATWGVESDVYRVRVLGLPPLGSSEGFLPAKLVLAAMKREPEATGRLEVGVDVARYGEDFSAVVGRRGHAVVHMDKRHGLGNPEVAAWAAQVVGELAEGEARDRRPIVRVDDGGVGGGVTDLLNLMVREGTLEATVEACNFGGAGDKWYATNAGVWWGNLRNLMQGPKEAPTAGVLGLPFNEELRTQLTSRGFATNLRGKIVLETKEHMKARGVDSPDLADALALAFASVGEGAVWMEYLRAEHERLQREGSAYEQEAAPA